MSDTPYVLLIDADPLAAMTISHSFVRHTIRHPLVHAVDAEAAILYLRHQCRDAPCLILLDTGGPGMSWDQTLQCLKAEESAAQVPVIALGHGSQDPLDSLRHHPGVADAVIREVDYAALSDQIGRLAKYWTELKLKAAAA